MDAKVRYSRQSEILATDQLQKATATVVGVGAIGRQVAIQLAAMGVGHLKLIDFDKVEESNIASQGYMENDLGKDKVEAVADLCKKISSTIKIDIFTKEFNHESTPVSPIVFCCVDRITTRGAIWNSIRDNPDLNLWIDGRMSAETFRVLSVDSMLNHGYYDKTLFTAEEAFTGSCTAKSTIYCASICAGMMVSSFAKWLRGMPVEKDFLYNILANEQIFDTEEQAEAIA